MNHAVIFLLSLAGFALLLLAMPRHQQDWLRRKLPTVLGRALRLSGFAALALAFAVAGAGLGWGYGAVAWFGWLTMAAALAVAANTNRERILRKVRP
ncbi:MAG: DUF3325 family protein [Sphingobium sp.]